MLCKPKMQQKKGKGNIRKGKERGRAEWDGEKRKVERLGGKKKGTV